MIELGKYSIKGLLNNFYVTWYNEYLIELGKLLLTMLEDYTNSF